MGFDEFLVGDVFEHSEEALMECSGVVIANGKHETSGHSVILVVSDRKSSPIVLRRYGVDCEYSFHEESESVFAALASNDYTWMDFDLRQLNYTA